MRQGVQISTAETVTVDVQLVIGSVQETVEVTETAPLIQSQSATVSTLVTNQEVVEKSTRPTIPAVGVCANEVRTTQERAGRTVWKQASWQPPRSGISS